MAYQIIVTAHFVETTYQTFKWLEEMWSVSSADKFQSQLESTIDIISKTPFAGRISRYDENGRSMIVTKHNRIYYRISSNIVELLELFETKQDPLKNKFVGIGILTSKS